MYLRRYSSRRESSLDSLQSLLVRQSRLGDLSAASEVPVLAAPINLHPFTIFNPPKESQVRYKWQRIPWRPFKWSVRIDEPQDFPLDHVARTIYFPT